MAVPFDDSLVVDSLAFITRPDPCGVVLLVLGTPVSLCSFLREGLNILLTGANRP